ncbi:MAG: class I SAM-dependent methyltransferase [Magnetococcales bacterium]|nr:class I SAM-dependent methyltransferase [Magnetococcales bacterium]
MIHRQPEPELMDDIQAGGCAAADFSQPHDHFVWLFRQHYPITPTNVLDLGCGPADILVRMAHAYPNADYDGIDGSHAMLAQGKRVLQQHLNSWLKNQGDPRYVAGC